MSKSDMGEQFKRILENLERKKPEFLEEAKKMVNHIKESHEKMFKEFENDTLTSFFAERGIHNPEETKGVYKIHAFRLKPEGTAYLREIFFVADHDKTKEEAMKNPEGIFLLQTSLNFVEDGAEVSSEIDELETVEF